MLSALSLCLALAGPAAAADYPAGYWERAYVGQGAPAASYNLTVQVADAAQAMDEVEKRMFKLGGKLTSVNNNSLFGQQGRASRMLVYSVDAQSAEETAKSFFSLGDLQMYNVSRFHTAKDGEEIREKLKALKTERDANANALSKMPIAAYFLETHIKQLEEALAVFEGGGARANLQITLVEPAPKGQAKTER